MPLPLADTDPHQRLRTIRATAEDLKAKESAEAVKALADVAEWVSANARHWAARMIALASPYNLVVTNVPGPRSRSICSARAWRPRTHTCRCSRVRGSASRSSPTGS